MQREGDVTKDLEIEMIWVVAGQITACSEKVQTAFQDSEIKNTFDINELKFLVILKLKPKVEGKWKQNPEQWMIFEKKCFLWKHLDRQEFEQISDHLHQD